MDRRHFFEMLGTASIALGLTASTASQASARPGRVEDRLRALGITLATPATPVAVYVPYRISGNQVFIAGQIPPADAATPTFGKLGKDLTVEDGFAAARMVAIRILAQLKVACGGDLDRVVQCIQLRGFVNSVDDFTAQSSVMNGASELLQQVFGDSGLAARAALGTNSLPLNAAVEIESVFEIRV